jgi:uncharacterized protein YkwD
MTGLLICACLIFCGPETDLVAEINREREASGIGTLEFDWELARIARYKTEEMAQLGFFGHESLLYGSPCETLARFGVEFLGVGANIAKGQDCPREVLDAWLLSPAHRENLLNAEFSAAGVGITIRDGIPFWSLILTSKNGS